MKFLVRAMRDGSGMSVEAAARELVDDLGLPADQVDAAVRKVRALTDRSRPRRRRAVVAGNIESWYLGSREDDKNWPALVEILRSDGWDATRYSMISTLGGQGGGAVCRIPRQRFGYDCRGLVLGYVQSGKTTNFTAVIAKAADAGYRFFIVSRAFTTHCGSRPRTDSTSSSGNHHPDLWFRLTDEDDFKPTR